MAMLYTWYNPGEFPPHIIRYHKKWDLVGTFDRKDRAEAWKKNFSTPEGWEKNLKTASQAFVGGVYTIGLIKPYRTKAGKKIWLAYGRIAKPRKR